ncbi:MAG: zinc ribbon domain-containing protein [Spongiibacteraceae bacterium]|nr:zinc ribbon domain-containing protein [Spongiibacteraceae bacterium]
MSGLIGLKEVPEQADAGTFECPHCQRKRNFRLNYYRNYFHLFGLPVWPWGRTGPLAECVVCHQRYHPANIERI